MFDLNDKTRTRVIPAGDPDERYGDLTAGAGDDSGVDPLDSEDMVHLHSRLMNYYTEELDRQEDNRAQMALDHDFYDGLQWTAEDAQALRERGQAPMVLNVISQSINWVLGSEKRGRTDWKVLPRRKEDGKPAERKTQLLKYLNDANDTTFHVSRAFEDAVIAGLGWMEDGVQEESDAEPIYSRYEDWRNMLWDSAATELDLSDARYISRSKWIDLDVITRLFPNRAGMLQASAGDMMRAGGNYATGDEPMDDIETDRAWSGGFGSTGTGRQRVRVIEFWFMLPTNVARLKGGTFSGDIFDASDSRHQRSLAEEGASTTDRTSMRMHCAVMTSAGLLWFGESPYRHNRYPFTPVWGYRYGRNKLPYGIVRGLRDLQEDINKRWSKALYILSSNKTIMDEGAVSNMQEFLDEVSRPNGVIQKKKGYDLTINADRELGPEHLQLMQTGIAMVQQVSGVTDELMGRSTNAKSGVAIQARQNQGQLSTSKLFDNLRYSKKQQGEKQLSLIEQFMTEQKQFRITNMRGTPEYVTVNDGLPENDIAHTKADFVIGEADWRATMRQAATDQLVDMLSKMPPQVAMVLLDLLVESMDIENRDEIVRRIRQINGQRDPDQTEPTPEDIARQQQEQQQAQLQQQQIMLQMRELASKAGKNEAEAQRIQALADQVRAMTVNTNVNSESVAITAAQSALMMGVPQVADVLLREAGWVPAPEQQANREMADAVAAVQARQQQDDQQQGQPNQPPQGQPAPQQPQQPAAPAQQPNEGVPA